MVYLSVLLCLSVFLNVVFLVMLRSERSFSKDCLSQIRKTDELWLKLVHDEMNKYLDRMNK